MAWRGEGRTLAPAFRGATTTLGPPRLDRAGRPSPGPWPERLAAAAGLLSALAPPLLACWLLLLTPVARWCRGVGGARPPARLVFAAVSLGPGVCLHSTWLARGGPPARPLAAPRRRADDTAAPLLRAVSSTGRPLADWRRPASLLARLFRVRVPFARPISSDLFPGLDARHPLACPASVGEADARWLDNYAWRTRCRAGGSRGGLAGRPRLGLTAAAARGWSASCASSTSCAGSPP